MSQFITLDKYIRGFSKSPLSIYATLKPWALTQQSADIVRRLLRELSLEEYVVRDEIALHRTSIVEAGAILKAPLILGPHCLVASGAYLRGGNWIDAKSTFGPGAELKSSFVFAGTKLAHFNFVGDSILGEGVNLEAGSVICNYRNEWVDKEIRVRLDEAVLRTGHDKFGALVGDGCRIGANAVLAPGTILVSVIRDYRHIPYIARESGLYLGELNARASARFT